MAKIERERASDPEVAEARTFAERLREVIATQGSANAFAKRIAVAESTMRYWLSGKAGPDVDTLVKIAGVAGVRLEWLATGEGGREGTSEGQVIPYLIRDTKPENRSGLFHDPQAEPLVPAPGLVYVMVSAGAKGYVIQELPQSPDDLTIRFVRGDAMESTMKDGDTALLDTSADEIGVAGLYGLVMAGAVEPMFRRCQRLPGGIVRAACDNPAYAGFDFKPGEDVEVIGQVIWLGHNI